MNAPETGGSGCFVRGCLAVCIAIFVLAVVLGLGGVFLYHRAVDRLTARQAVDVLVTTPTQVEYENARAGLDRLRTAIASNQEQTITLSATDLNALVAREHDFSAARGRVHFAIVDSIMTLDLSTSINFVPWFRGTNRWFNGRLQFSFSYEYDQFSIRPIYVEAGNWRIPSWILSSEFAESFSRSFSRSFRDGIEKNPQGAAVWNHIKAIKVDGDSLVVTTQRIGS